MNKHKLKYGITTFNIEKQEILLINLFTNSPTKEDVENIDNELCKEFNISKKQIYWKHRPSFENEIKKMLESLPEEIEDNGVLDI